eukprot:scaffold52681_cov37-Tisochrysis_lutea.AAC.2
MPVLDDASADSLFTVSTNTLSGSTSLDSLSESRAEDIDDASPSPSPKGPLVRTSDVERTKEGK